MRKVGIQLLTFDGCPLADAARVQLEQALSDCGVSGYEEIDLLGPDTPDDLPGWGSPTILVNGVNVTGQPKGNSVSCRIYPGPERVPEARRIIASIENAKRADTHDDD